MSTPKTYKFDTLQELFDTVPSNRMRDCMAELTEFFVSTKAHLEVVVEILSDCEVPESLATLPTPIEWIDDNRGEITTQFTTHEGGPVVLTITNQKQ